MQAIGTFNDVEWINDSKVQPLCMAAANCLVLSSSGAPLCWLSWDYPTGVPIAIQHASSCRACAFYLVRCAIDGMHALLTKATNVEAAVTGISCLEKAAVVLLGGLAKRGPCGSLGFSRVAKALSCHRDVVVFGHDGPEIARELRECGIACSVTSTLHNAVELACERALPGRFAGLLAVASHVRMFVDCRQQERRLGWFSSMGCW